MHQTPVLDAGATTVNKIDKVSALLSCQLRGDKEQDICQHSPHSEPLAEITKDMLSCRALGGLRKWAVII